MQLEVNKLALQNLPYSKFYSPSQFLNCLLLFCACMLVVCWWFACYKHLVYSVFQVGCPEEIKNGSCPCLYK